jgi:hypothetical protein
MQMKNPYVYDNNYTPLSITIITWLFIAVGIVGFAYHATEINFNDLFGNDLFFALLVRLLAVVGGIFLLRGKDWARYLLAAWLAYHVVLSFFHTLTETAMHAVLLAVVVYFLFRSKVLEYFRGRKSAT